MENGCWVLGGVGVLFVSVPRLARLSVLPPLPIPTRASYAYAGRWCCTSPVHAAVLVGPREQLAVEVGAQDLKQVPQEQGPVPPGPRDGVVRAPCCDR